MEGDGGGHTAALAELHRLLDDALARARLDKTTLARRAGLGRTTVQDAFRPGAVPSAETAAALARALGLETAELLELRRAAAEPNPAVGGRSTGPGRPIDQWDPHDLEVHPAGAVPGPVVSGRAGRVLPGYVERAHDGVLNGAVQDARAGRSRMVVLVGTSSTGKTRACWEAVQPLAAHGWRLWHPNDPTRADAALADLHRVGPRTVVWLNEAQHYLGDPDCGEQVAAAVHTLLTSPDRGPVVVLGTLWPEYEARYVSLPYPGGADRHSRTRELLAGRTLTVPDRFDDQALAQAARLADGDALLAGALTRASGTGRLTQDLAGAPELLRCYDRGTAPARALLQAAMDARRLGMGLHLPFAFLVDAAMHPAYLGEEGWDDLAEDWAEAAFAELARPVHGKQAPLRRTRARPGAVTASAASGGPVYRLADYLEQHGRRERRHACPPATFWEAAARHTTSPAELAELAHAAHTRSRYRHAATLYRQAFDAGRPGALLPLARMRERVGDPVGAERLYRQAVDAGHSRAFFELARMRERVADPVDAERFYRMAADAGSSRALLLLARARERDGDLAAAERLARLSVDAGYTDALLDLGRMRDQDGDSMGAERLYRQAADAGHSRAFLKLATMRERVGDPVGAERLYRQVADAGNTGVLRRLGTERERAGDPVGAERFYRPATDVGDSGALLSLARIRERTGDSVGAAVLYRQAADAGNADALVRLAAAREEVGDPEGAAVLYRRAADVGNAGHILSDVLGDLAMAREEAGDVVGAERFARLAADTGRPGAFFDLAMAREEAGDVVCAERFARLAADAGHTLALGHFAGVRERAGDPEGAERLYWLAADAGDTNALLGLARLRKKAGDSVGAERFARLAADAGDPQALGVIARIPAAAGYPVDEVLTRGLEPDGAVSPPW